MKHNIIPWMCMDKIFFLHLLADAADRLASVCVCLWVRVFRVSLKEKKSKKKKMSYTMCVCLCVCVCVSSQTANRAAHKSVPSLPYVSRSREMFVVPEIWYLWREPVETLFPPFFNNYFFFFGTRLDSSFFLKLAALLRLFMWHTKYTYKYIIMWHTFDEHRHRNVDFAGRRSRIRKSVSKLSISTYIVCVCNFAR